MSAAKSVLLSDDVQRAVADSEDIDEAYALLNAASDNFLETGRPMTLEEALATIHGVARQIETLG